MYRGAVSKLVGIPLGNPSYRLRALEFRDRPAENARVLIGDLDRCAGPWFLVDLRKTPGEPPSAYADAVAERYHLEPLPVRSPLLSILVHEDGPTGDIQRNGSMSPIRLAVLCDFPEEGWPSMDLVAEMILDQLVAEHAGRIDATRICPPFRHAQARWEVPRGRWARNADRVLNRYRDYPRALAAWQVHDRFDLFHVVDHSYASWSTSCPPVDGRDLPRPRHLPLPARTHADPRPAWFRGIVRRTLDGLRRAAAVVCDSESTRQGLLAATGSFRPTGSTSSTSQPHPECSPDADPAADAEASRWLGPAPDRPAGSGPAPRRLDDPTQADRRPPRDRRRRAP